LPPTPLPPPQKYLTNGGFWPVVSQVVFYWTLLARHVSRFYDANPGLRPAPPPFKSEDLSKDEIKLSEEQEAQIKDIFDLFDTDGGNSIDRQELAVAMCALGFQNADLRGKALNQESEKLLDTIDADRSDSVTLEEFNKLMKGELLLTDPLEEIKTVFAGLCGMDTSEPDVINLSKLHIASQRFNVRLSEKELNTMLHEVDNDGSAAVDLPEFIRVMSMSAWF
jgi:Ca2+-binding EF-hand superfamily protein